MPRCREEAGRGPSSGESRTDKRRNVPVTGVNSRVLLLNTSDEREAFANNPARRAALNIGGAVSPTTEPTVNDLKTLKDPLSGVGRVSTPSTTSAWERVARRF